MKRKLRTELTRVALVVSLWLFVGLGPGVALAEDGEDRQKLAKVVEKLERRVSDTVKRADRYLEEVRGRDLDSTLGEAVEEERLLKEDLRGYGGQVATLKNCIVNIVNLGLFLERSPWAKAAVFDGRFDKEKRNEFWDQEGEKKLRERLQKLKKCDRGNLKYDDEKGHPRCCSNITDVNNSQHNGLITPDLQFSKELGGIWKSFTDDFSFLSRNAIKLAEVRFDRKLIEGFPGMPWEYVFNIHGSSIYGPSPHQIIWAHFNLGFEDGVQVAPGDNRIQPVLTLQGFGYNRYFLSKDKGVWRKLNYLGVAGIITLNGRKGVTAVRYGGVVHFGNYVSVGSTYGGGVWRVYASSNKVVDQILRIWN